VSNFNPIPRLQQIASTLQDGGHFDAPATAAHYIECAIKEIETLRKERDEARREVCNLIDAQSQLWCKDVAKHRGWDCFTPEVTMEERNAALDRIAQFDQENGFL